MSTSLIIASGNSLSNAVSLSTALLCGVVMPAAWTSANLTFQASIDGGVTFNNVFDDAGNELTMTAAASRYIVLANIGQWIGFGPNTQIKLRSGTSGSPVTQGSDRVIQLSVTS